MLRLCQHRLLVNLLHLLRLLVHLLRDNGVGSRRAHRRLRGARVVHPARDIRLCRVGAVDVQVVGQARNVPAVGLRVPPEEGLLVELLVLLEGRVRLEV